MVLISVSAHDIDTAGLTVESALPLEWLKQELSDADLEGRAPGHFSGRLSRSGGDIVVRGRIRAELTTPCARCLEPAILPIDTEISLLLRLAPTDAARPRAHDGKHEGKHANGHGSGVRAGQKEPEEYEFSSEEADVDTYDGETVVLDSFVREAILLEIPNFPLCSEACPGIRPAAHEPEPEPTVDPRLRPLGALRAKLAAERPGSEGSAPAPSKPAARSPEPESASQHRKKKE